MLTANASQRSKIRDLHDLSELAGRPLNRDTIRSLSVLKLWSSKGRGLDFAQFKARIEDGTDYNVADLQSLLRKDQSPELKDMIRRVGEGFRFLGVPTDLEKMIACDSGRRRRDEVNTLITKLIGSAHTP